MIKLLKTNEKEEIYEIKNFKNNSKDWFKIPFNSLSNVQQGTNKNEKTGTQSKVL